MILQHWAINLNRYCSRALDNIAWVIDIAGIIEHKVIENPIIENRPRIGFSHNSNYGIHNIKIGGI